MAFRPMTAMLDADMLTSKVQALRGGCHFAARGMLATLIGGCLKQSCRSWNQTATNRGFRDKNAQLGLIRRFAVPGGLLPPGDRIRRPLRCGKPLEPLHLGPGNRGKTWQPAAVPVKHARRQGGWKQTWTKCCGRRAFAVSVVVQTSSPFPRHEEPTSTSDEQPRL